MSSFNGERYIEEQIDSILRQTGVEVSLFIRDDGSTDGTVHILEKYAARDNIEVVFGSNLGIGNSFMELLYSVPEDYDYYAFSDQDDIWDHDKLVTAVRRLSSESGCLLYASNLECVDTENHTIRMRFDPDMVFDDSLLSAICRSKCYGCTQVFNKELLLFLRRSRPAEQLMRTRLHDTWVAVSAAAAGKIIFDSESHIRYRRHGENYTKFDCGKAACWKISFSKLVFSWKRNPRSKTAREVIRHYRKYVDSDEDRDLIYALAFPSRIKNRAALIKNRKRFNANLPGESDVRFVFKVIIGLV